MSISTHAFNLEYIFVRLSCTSIAAKMKMFITEVLGHLAEKVLDTKFFLCGPYLARDQIESKSFIARSQKWEH